MMHAPHRFVAFLAENEEQFDPTIVSPGVQGFIWTAAVAVAVIFLGISLVRRLRRNAYRHQIREEIAAELAAREAAGDGAGGADDGDTSAGGTSAGDDEARG